MLKFFRKIRQNLLLEGKTGKYFKYAIGEILLVVIGILIALSINNWNENRKTASEEQLLLKDLQIDLQSNLEQLRGKQRYLTLLQSKTKILADDFLNKKLNQQMILKADTLVGLLQSRATFDPNEGIINELISSGKLRSFKNKKLRNYLSAWSSNMRDIKETEGQLQIISHKLRDYLNTNYSFADVYGGSRLLKYPEGRTNFPTSKKDIFNDIAFENYISRLSRARSVLLNRLKEFEVSLAEVLQVLEEEIE